MSGTVVFDDDENWSASSGIFNWVVAFLIDRVEVGPTRDELSLIDEQNFRWLDLTRLPEGGRASVVRALSSALVPHAEENLPHTSHRDATLNVIRELADLAAGRGEPGPK
jgi:hypothetical protein